MVFPVVLYGCESWTVKKAEHRGIDAFELWCWRRLLRAPWTARRSNQSILKEISPGYSLEGLMLKLKLQYFGHLMQRVDSLEKTLMLEGIGGRRRRGWQRMRWLDGITDLMDVGWWTPGVGDGQGGLVCCGSWGHKELDTTERLNWTELEIRRYDLTHWSNLIAPTKYKLPLCPSVGYEGLLDKSKSRTVYKIPLLYNLQKCQGHETQRPRNCPRLGECDETWQLSTRHESRLDP